MMMEFSLEEKLQQLANAKAGSGMPEFLKGSFDNWGMALSEMAQEALDEIRLWKVAAKIGGVKR